MLDQTDSIPIEGEDFVVKRCYPFRWAFLNDIHCCSQYGLFPRSYTDHYGTTTLLNQGQTYLHDKLDEFALECYENQVNTLLVPGDVTAGSNRKESGKYVMNIELDEQSCVAAQLIADFCSGVPSIKEVWIWKGTGYHGSQDMSMEKSVAKELSEKYHIATRYWGEYSYINLEYRDRKKTLWITHTAPNASMYPEQAMGKDMMTYQEATAQGKVPPVDMIIRAHKHSFIEVHKPSIRALQLPCWQFAVPYDGTLENFGKWQPDIGGVIMLFDEKLRSTVWHFTYPNLPDPNKFINVVRGGVQPAVLR
jgi:hypothetical protein